MHLVDLGVILKVLVCLKSTGRLDISKADELIAQIRPFVPDDFTRKPRYFIDLERFKATELRFFGLYAAPVFFLKCCNDPAITEHFLQFFVAYRLLHGVDGKISESDLNIASQLIEKFVHEFPRIYGEEQVSFNVHSLLHLTEFSKKYGPVNNYSAYRYENFYQLLRKWIRKGSHYFEQVYTRWSQTSGKVKRKVSTNFGSFSLRSNKKDSCVLLQNDKIAIIQKITKTINGPVFKCNVFQKQQSFFEYPITSAYLQIFEVGELSETEETFTLKDIKRKMMRIPLEEDFVVMPLIHT